MNTITEKINGAKNLKELAETLNELHEEIGVSVDDSLHYYYQEALVQ